VRSASPANITSLPATRSTSRRSPSDCFVYRFFQNRRNILSASPLLTSVAVRGETIITLTGVHAAKQGAQIQRHALRKISGEDLNGSKQMSFRPRDRPRGPVDVTADLAEYLSSDRYPLHSRLPPERQLCELLQVSRTALQKRSGGTGKRGSDLAPCWQGHVRRGRPQSVHSCAEALGADTTLSELLEARTLMNLRRRACRPEIGTIRPCAHEAIRGPRSDCRKLGVLGSMG
jgi:hypothetical protein